LSGALARKDYCCCAGLSVRAGVLANHQGVPAFHRTPPSREVPMIERRVLGADVCSKGWVGVATGPGGTQAYFGPAIGDLLTAAEADGLIDVVAIDIPIGLPDRSLRRADELARAVAGDRWQSVFMTPVRDALVAADHATSVKINRRLAGAGVSRQAYGLRSKIFEVEAWLRVSGRTVIEAHPEVCFATIAGHPLTTRKKTWAGAEQRRKLLDGAGIRLGTDLGMAGEMAAVDDVLDAAATAWTARRLVTGEARSLPGRPEVFSDGIGCAIWA
jgi:predicted RNase H-like nuclease